MDGWIDRCIRGRAGDIMACDGGGKGSSRPGKVVV